MSVSDSALTCVNNVSDRDKDEVLQCNLYPLKRLMILIMTLNFFKNLHYLLK
jgi:hypothetical protein